jgi:hypothetical protein
LTEDRGRERNIPWELEDFMFLKGRDDDESKGTAKIESRIAGP